MLRNETPTTQSVSLRIERDGEPVYDELHTVDAWSEIVIEEAWMSDAGMYEFSVTRANDDQEVASGRAIPGDYEKGACIDVKIQRGRISIYQQLADGSCP